MSDEKNAFPLCDQFEFHADWRDAQLALIGLDSYSRDDVHWLHDRVLTQDVIAAIVDRLYDPLMRHAGAAELLSSFDISHLRERQKQFLAGFGNWFRDTGYFESRLALGVVHARVGVPLSLYVSSVGLLQTFILEAVLDRVESHDDRRRLNDLVVKLASLDVALATEVYQRARSAETDRPPKQTGQHHHHLHRQLEQDALTGLSSRTSVLQELAVAIGRAAKTGQPLVAVMLDLDHFKDVNDNHGHAAGDRVLQDLAARVKAALREFDLVGRYGGEEFVVVLENTSLHTAHQVAERIRRRICDEPLGSDGLAVEVTVSQGLSLYRDGDDVQALLRRADAAMHRAKSAGRNCVVQD
jgi:two-component system cell cycle response regulator